MSDKSLLSFFIQYLNQNKYRLANNFEGRGLKHYAFDFFPRQYIQTYTLTRISFTYIRCNLSLVIFKFMYKLEQGKIIIFLLCIWIKWF